jgi:hypothetical protein
MVVKATSGRQIRGTQSKGKTAVPASHFRAYALYGSYTPGNNWFNIEIQDVQCGGRATCGQIWYYNYYYPTAAEASDAFFAQQYYHDPLNYQLRLNWNYERL